MAQDPRQLSRLVPGGTPTIVPPEPNLAEVYESGKSSGLGSVFKSYDQARAGWRTKLGQMHQNLTRAQEQKTTDHRIWWQKHVRRGNSFSEVSGANRLASMFSAEIIRRIEVRFALEPESTRRTGASDYVSVTLPSEIDELYVLRVFLLPYALESSNPSAGQCTQRITSAVVPFRSVQYVAWLDQDTAASNTDPNNPIYWGVQLGSVYLELV